MAEFVSRLIRVGPRGARYIIYVLNEARYNVVVQRALNAALPLFADQIGVDGRSIRANPSKTSDVVDDMRGKAWPEPVAQRMREEAGPFLVITQEAFAEFDPAQHDWRIILLASAARPSNTIPHLFEVLGRAIVQKKSVFEYLDSMKGPAGESSFGQIIGPGDDLAEPSPPKLGRPSVLDPEWDILGRITRAIDAKDWPEESRLNKTAIAKQVRREVYLEPNDFYFTEKSIVTALARKNLWGQFDDQVARLKQRQTRR